MNGHHPGADGAAPVARAGAAEPAARDGAAEPAARLFVCVWPTPEVFSVIASLERPSLDALRWTTPAQWHVTLAFLGNVPESRIEELGRALQVAAAQVVDRPEARLGPGTQRVGRSILCVPVDGLEDLAAVVRRSFAAVLTGAGADGPFHGHITLARARGRRPVPASLAGRPLVGRWEVGGMDLVRSALEPSGARYTTVATATFPSCPS